MADIVKFGIDPYTCDLSDLPGWVHNGPTKVDKYGCTVNVGQMVKFADINRMCERYGMSEKWEISYMSDWFRVVAFAANGTHLTLVGWNGLEWTVMPDEVTVYGLK